MRANGRTHEVWALNIHVDRGWSDRGVGVVQSLSEQLVPGGLHMTAQALQAAAVEGMGCGPQQLQEPEAPHKKCQAEQSLETRTQIGAHCRSGLRGPSGLRMKCQERYIQTEVPK